MSGRDVARVVFWTLAWSMASAFVTLNLLGWPFLPRILVGGVVTAVAMNMTRERSLRWRYLMARHWGVLNRPLVLDEDGRIRGKALPFEALCFRYDEHGPTDAHVHTRTLVLGRPRVRAWTTWRESS